MSIPYSFSMSDASLATTFFALSALTPSPFFSKVRPDMRLPSGVSTSATRTVGNTLKIGWASSSSKWRPSRLTPPTVFVIPPRTKGSPFFGSVLMMLPNSIPWNVEKRSMSACEKVFFVGALASSTLVFCGSIETKTTAPITTTSPIRANIAFRVALRLSFSLYTSFSFSSRSRCSCASRWRFLRSSTSARRFFLASISCSVGTFLEAWTGIGADGRCTGGGRGCRWTGRGGGGVGALRTFGILTGTAATTSGISTRAMSPAIISAHDSGRAAGSFDKARKIARVKGVSGVSGAGAAFAIWYSICPRWKGGCPDMHSYAIAASE